MAFYFEKSKVYFLNDTIQKKYLLLDYTPLKNHSAISSYGKNKKMETVDFLIKWIIPLYKEYRDLDLQNADAYLVIWFLVVQELINKYRYLKILEIGSNMTSLLSESLKHFNESSFLVCILHRSQVSDNCSKNVSYVIDQNNFLPFEKNYFDLVIVEDDSRLSNIVVFDRIVKAIRNQGLILIVGNLCSKNTKILMKKYVFFVYRISEKKVILFKKISSLEKKNAIEQLPEVKIEKIKFRIRNDLFSIGNKVKGFNLLETEEELDKLIKMVNDTENLVCEIFSQLISIDLKYNLNLLKEALINYRLKLGNTKKLLKTCKKMYEIIEKDLKRSEDFKCLDYKERR